MNKPEVKLCPLCEKEEGTIYPYDTFYVPEHKQEMWCEDCFDREAEIAFDRAHR